MNINVVPHLKSSYTSNVYGLRQDRAQRNALQDSFPGIAGLPFRGLDRRDLHSVSEQSLLLSFSETRLSRLRRRILSGSRPTQDLVPRLWHSTMSSRNDLFSVNADTSQGSKDLEAHLPRYCGPVVNQHLQFENYRRSSQNSLSVELSYPASNRNSRVELSHVRNQTGHSRDNVSAYLRDSNQASVHRNPTTSRSQAYNSGMRVIPVTNPEDSMLTGNVRGPRRNNTNNDEFAGPTQYLAPPSSEVIADQERDLPLLPTNLLAKEQDEILRLANYCLSCCALNFVAKHRFPIPIDPKMRRVERPEDREWTEWVYLLKRLATKRRIPAHLLYNDQIKQLITVLENSLEMRHAAMHQSRPLKDDRNILQLVSAGIQVAQILKDASAMECLVHLYTATENEIQQRKSCSSNSSTGPAAPYC